MHHWVLCMSWAGAEKQPSGCLASNLTNRVANFVKKKCFSTKFDQTTSLIEMSTLPDGDDKDQVIRKW